MALLFPEYESLDATGLAGLIRGGQVTSLELLDAAWQRMHLHNPALNAVCWADRMLGEQAAALVDIAAPLAGVPFLLKDGGASAAGLTLTFGSVSARAWKPSEDGELTTRYRRAGLVVFGRTTSPEYGINVSCEGNLYGGPTRNPWNLDHSAGGSSSGAAAAVAAGIVPMAHGSDGGGSLRIPASCCGLFTLKVTRARLPHGPGYGESWAGMATSHVICRTVRDSAMALDATHGPDLGAPYVAPAPAISYVAALSERVRPLRIGYSTACPDGSLLHSDCSDAVKHAAKLCESLGHFVSPVPPPELDTEAMALAMRELVCANTACEVDAFAKSVGRPAAPDEFEKATWSAAELGRGLSASQYLLALQRLHRSGRAIAKWCDPYDVVLTATLAEPPAKLGRFVMDRDYTSHRIATLAYAPLTPLANVSGQPAISVPLHWNAAGLPIGVQFLGRYGDESTLLQLACQLEAAAPWFHIRPPVDSSSMTQLPSNV